MSYYRMESNTEADILTKYARQAGVPCRFALVSTEPVVMAGRSDLVDYLACAELGLELIEIGYNGGPTVAFPGDLTIADYGGDAEYGPRALSVLAEDLTARGVEARVEGNDLMVGDRKCASWVSGLVSGFRETGVHFSMTVNPEIIRRVSKKPIEKTPGELGPYGYTAERILRLIEGD